MRALKYILMVVLLLASTTTVVLSNEGFCFSQARFVSDADLIEAAIHNLAEQKQMAIDSSDASVKDFLRRNPNCCGVDRHPSWRTWLDVLTGWNSSEVEVNFEMNPKRTYLLSENYYKQWVSISSCGKFLKYGHGTSTPKLETVHSVSIGLTLGQISYG